MAVAELTKHGPAQAPAQAGRAAAPAAPRQAGPAASAPVDPSLSIAHAYRFERARRTLRSAHRDERRRAARRFWFALAGLLVGVVAVAAATASELQRLFGI